MKICLLLVFPSQTSKTDMIDVLQPLKIEYCHTIHLNSSNLSSAKINYDKQIQELHIAI